MLGQLMGGDGDAAAELAAAFPGLPGGVGPGGGGAGAGTPRPVVSVNKGTKKKKKGGRVTPPKAR
jgi:hypothetical protein